MRRSKYKKAIFASFLVVILAMSQVLVQADTTQVTPTENNPVTTPAETIESTEAVEVTQSEEGNPEVVVEAPQTQQESKEQQKPVALASTLPKSWTDVMDLASYVLKLNGSEIVDTPAVIVNGDKLDIALEWSVPSDSDNRVQPGDTATFKLPKGFTIQKDFAFKLLENDLGYYEYDAESHTVKLTFGDGVLSDETLEGFKGWLNISTEFTSKTVVVNEEIEIVNPFNDKILQVFKPTLATENNSIIKTGYRDGSTNIVKWHVFVNANYQDLKDVVVKDLIPSELNVTKIEVYDYNLTMANEVTGRTLKETIENVTSNNLEVKLGNITTPKEIVIYTTADKLPIIGNSVTLKNKATLTSTDTPDKESNEAVVNYKLDPLLNKTGSKYNKADRTFAWSVGINPGAITLAKDTVVKDTLNPANVLKYLEDSFEFTVNNEKLTLDEFKTKYSDTYEVTINDVTSTFEIKYLKESSHTININYKTQVPEDKISSFNGTVKNSLTLTSEGKSTDTSGSGSGYDKGIISKGATINYQDKTVEWKVRLNTGNHNLTRIQLADNLVDGVNALTYIDSTFKLINETTKAEIDILPLIKFVTDANGKATGFTLDYTPETTPFTDTYALVYKTSYTPELKAQKFSNRADTILTTKDGTDLTGRGVGSVTVRAEELANGAKNGKYDPKTQEFTWTIYLNYNGLDINTYDINDTLTENQKFIEGSVRVFAYEITNAAGNYKEIAGASQKLNTYTFEESVLNIKVAKADVDAVAKTTPQRIAVEFKTSMDGNYIPESVKNVATVNYGKDGITSTTPITVEATVPLKDYFGGNLAEKSLNYREVKGVKYFDWTLTLNKSNSKFDTYSIHDAINNTHTYDRSTLQVYSATNVGGSIVEKKLLTEGTDYTIKYSEVAVENQPNSETLDIDFKTVAADRMFIVKYTTVALLEVGKVEYSNALSVSASTRNRSVTTTPVVQKKELTIGEGGISATSQSYSIRKVDASGVSLEGVQFELYYEKSGKLAASGSTDADGILKFTPLFTGKYILKEVSTLPGYGISKEYASGKIVEVNESTTKAVDPFEVTNIINAITVEKRSSVPGTTDLTTEFDIINNVTKEKVGSFTTNDQGHGVFDNNGKGLLPGEYAVVETKAPVGHIIDPTPQIITVVEGVLFNEDGSQNLEFVNHKGSVIFTKTDAKGNGISLPITFDLYTADGKYLSSHKTQDAIFKIDNALEPGDYYFLEQAPEKDFVRNPKKVPFTIPVEAVGIPETIELSAVNYPSLIEFKKVNAQGNPLADAEFGIYKYEENASYDSLVNSVKTATSNSQGLVSFYGMPEGRYIIKELSAPSTYLLNKTLIPVSITVGEENAPIYVNPIKEGFVNVKGSVTLTKYDGSLSANAQDILTGVTFDLYKGKPSDTNVAIQTGLKTNNLGQIVVSGLESGDYYFVETQTNEGFFINPTPVQFTIKNNGDKTYTEAVSLTNYKANVSFTKTDGVSGLAGATFTLEKDGVVVQEGILSDANGKVTFKDLGSGRYTYYETSAPKDYLRNTTVYSFELDASLEAKQPLEQTATDVINYKGSVTLSKVDVKGTPLANAVYRILNDANVQIGDTYTTDELGRIEIKNVLTPGSYVFEEVQAPNGFIRDTQTIPFIISDNAEDVPEIVNVSHTNYKATVSFNKIDTAKNPIEGAIFTLYNDAEEALQEATSDAKGRVEFKDVEPGTYTIKETQAAQGYILNTETIVFTVDDEASGEVNVILDDFINYEGSFELNKVDRNGKFIGDARFELYDASNSLVREFITRNGSIVIEGLAPGKYTLKEVAAPSGYLLSKDLLEITIVDEAEGQPLVQSFNFVNEPTPVVKGVTKTPKDTLPATGMDNSTIFAGTSIFAIGIAVIGLSMLRKNNRREEE